MVIDSRMTDGTKIPVEPETRTDEVLVISRHEAGSLYLTNWETDCT